MSSGLFKNKFINKQLVYKHGLVSYQFLVGYLIPYPSFLKNDSGTI